jgi:hypothetical protein
VEEIVGRLNGGELIALTAIVMSIGGGTLVAVIAIVTVQWRLLRQAQMDASLKHEMIARGLSAADIRCVMEAARGKRHLDRPASTLPDTNRQRVQLRG